MGKSCNHYTEVPKVFGERDPSTLDFGIIEVYYYQGEVEGIAFICPCGCGRAVWIPIHNPVKKEHHWQYRNLTLTPSVRWLSGCKAHFNITDGAVVWHTDSGK